MRIVGQNVLLLFPFYAGSWLFLFGLDNALDEFEFLRLGLAKVFVAILVSIFQFMESIKIELSNEGCKVVMIEVLGKELPDQFRLVKDGKTLPCVAPPDYLIVGRVLG